MLRIRPRPSVLTLKWATMAIRIDSREHDLVAQCLQDGLEHTVETLPVADIAIGTFFLFERKRVDDFAASIKDGRWREQKARMLAWRDQHPECRVFYIIEGSMGRTPMPKKTLFSAMANTILRDGIHVLRTASIAETALYLRVFSEKCGQTLASHSGIRAPTTKRKRAEDNAWLRMLMCVKGVSERVAEAIVAVYPTLPTLQEQLRAEPKALRDITVGKRHIGKQTLRYLQEMFL